MTDTSSMVNGITETPENPATKEGPVVIEISLRELNGKEIPAVTSLQVAEAFEKEHRNILRDIRETLSKCPESFSALNFELAEYADEQGKSRPMYLLSKDGLMMLTMGYTTPKAMEIKAAYIECFNEMERELAERAKSYGGYDLPRIPTSFSDALRMIADIEEEKQLALEQRDFYRRTKAEIGSRREATAMASASRWRTAAEAVADRLGEGKTWKQVKAIEWLLDEFAPSRGMYSQVGRKLSDLGRRMGKPPRIVEDSEYGHVKIHHVDVIDAFRAALALDPRMLNGFRPCLG